MKRTAVAMMIAVAATAAIAQSPNTPVAQPQPEVQKVVATINGETITRARLDILYANLNAQMRERYEAAGGKTAFLDNYIAKRLLIQEAVKSGFDQRPEVKVAADAARESAIFDRYIRDVVASEFVTESDLRQSYEGNKDKFAVPEQVKARHIVVSFNKWPKEQARAGIEKVLGELRASGEITVGRFSAAARQYSEDASAESGGELGWKARGVFDKAFEEAAFSLKPGTMSGIVESSFGYHLIFVEDKKPAGTRPFEEVRADIRDLLVSQKAPEVMSAVARLNNELRRTGKVAIHTENLD